MLGRVGRIDTRTTSTGTKITNISMVTSKKYVKNGEKQEKVTWHNVTLFMKLAEIAEKYVSVGDLLYIQGEMDSQKYTGKDGQERTNFIIIASELKLMPKGKEQKPAPKDNSYQAGVEADDDVPW